MSPIHETEQARPQHRRLLCGPMILLALVIIVRFLLEAAASHWTPPASFRPVW
jgi:hypothetical protein